LTAVILLSLCSAIAYGLSDFVGGTLARRTSAWAVAATSQATATLLTVILLWMFDGLFHLAPLLWGALAGIGSGAGNVLIFRGLAAGRMTIVAPVSAIAAATIPVFVGVLAGERPGHTAAVGVLTALPAIWLVSGGGLKLRSGSREDVVNGLSAGAGFGLQFSALGQVPQEAGMIPLAVSQGVSVLVIVVGAAMTSAPWLPRDGASRLGAVAGLLAGLATLCFQLAVQRGALAITAVLTSLYPAVTVLCAALVMREHIERGQAIGLALAGAAVVLIVWS
jgi:drug/metabolite transporter (DMT)-like permease